MKEARIKLDMSLQQATILSEALEIVSRLHSGQLDVLNQTGARCSLTRSSELTQELYDNLHGGHYHGIRSQEISDKARVLWDMHQVMRHHLAWRDQPNTAKEERSGAQMFCNFDKPHLTSFKEKQLIGMEEVNYPLAKD